jgi:hypothetical protein
MVKYRKWTAVFLVAIILAAAGPAWVQSSLVDLNARWDCSRSLVRLRWETIDGTDTMGFHVWKSTRRDGTYLRITDEIYPAGSGGFDGAVYVFEDQDVYRGRTYYYEIEERRFDGDEIFYGPVRAIDDCRDHDDDDHTLIATCFISALR